MGNATDSFGMSVLSNSVFWTGVLGSVLAAAIVGIIVYIFRNSLNIVSARRIRTKEEAALLETSLQLSSPFAPFAFGVVQARALRYFLTAVFIAYIGDIAEPFYPFNILFYIIALYYIYLGLKWFYKIERQALKIISDNA